MPWDDGLVGNARDIAAFDGAPLRVQAGPGTGKTFVLQRRVMRALEAGIPAEDILVVTFTRVAATDLRESLENLGVPGCDTVDARTLHSFCFSWLWRQDVFATLDRVPRPLIGVYRLGWIQYEFHPLLEDLKHDNKVYGDKKARTKRLRAFEAAWARKQRDEVTEADDPVDRAFEKELIDWLTFHKAITIGELVPITLRHLNLNPLDPILRKCRYVIVDEYQDLNKVEQVLVDKIAERCQLTIVGDADQSIYSFKHANPDGIVEFAERHRDVVDHNLTECRRCPTTVVQAANRLITCNTRLTKLLLEPREGNPAGNITQVQWPSMDAEVQGISSYVKYLVDPTRDDGKPVYETNDILILCPARDIAYLLRDKLTELEVPAHSFYHEEALEGMDARLSFCTLNLFVEPEDRVALRYWLGADSASWLANQYAILRELCEQESKSPRIILDEIIDTGRVVARIPDLIARYKQFRLRINGLYAVDTDGLLDILFPDGVKWAEAFRDLIAAVRESSVRPTVVDYFKQMRDYITQPELPSHPDYVRIMSLYKSKGLTSKVVIITSAVDGCIPRYERDATRAEANAKKEEQRRLFYVAITRPSEALVISHFLTLPKKLQFRAGAKLNIWRRTYPSPFISDAGRYIPAATGGNDWLRRLGL